MRYLALLIFLTGCLGQPFASYESDGGADRDSEAFAIQGGGEAGAGGSPVAGGAPAGGAASGGSVASGGTSAGGAGGSPAGGSGAADGGACQVPTLAGYQLPATFSWSSFAWQAGEQCLHCAEYPCSSCAIGWQPLAQEGAVITARLASDNCDPVAISAGVCGAEVDSCVDWLWNLSTAIVTFEVVQMGDGWQPDPSSIDVYFRSVLSGDVRGNCGDAAAIAPPDAIDAAAAADLAAAFEALRFGCG